MIKLLLVSLIIAGTALIATRPATPISNLKLSQIHTDSYNATKNPIIAGAWFCEAVR